MYYDFDRSGKVLGIRGPVAMSFEYDSGRRRTAVKYPSGADTAYGYDIAGRLSGIAHGLFESMTYGYDPAGNVNSSERTAGTIASTTVGEMSYARQTGS